MLEDDILLGIFDYYRLDDENDWNVRLGWWCTLSHVCRRWRYLIHSSALHLSMHIRCTNGSPIVDTLDHLPPLPLLIDYRDDGYWTVNRFHECARNSRSLNELGIYNALKLRDRVRDIELCVSHPTLGKSLLLMDKPFPILENLVLSFRGDDTSLTPLKISPLFLAPHLRNLELFGIHLPKRLRLLSSTPSLVSLKLRNIQASGYIRPRLLAARLESLPQLEELLIEFSIPIPRPRAERLLLGKQGTPVVLSNLKSITFRGVSAYLERLISQIRAPVLWELNITLFNQLAFTLTHLSQFINITEQIKFPRTASIEFLPGTSITLSHRVKRWHPGWNQGFTLDVMCKPLDWQIDCAAQVCGALMSALSGIESLTLIKSSSLLSRATSDSETNENDYTTTWAELLRSFVGVKELGIDPVFIVELSRTLELDEIGLDPGLLPDLQELKCISYGNQTMHADNLFGSFIHARQVAGHPVSLRLPPRSQSVYYPPLPRSPS